MVVPLALALLGLFFAFVSPGLHRGIDLRGGLLITLQSSAPIDAPAVQAELSKFSPSVEVRSVSSPGGGTGLEIELENNPVLEKADEDARALSELDSQLSQAELAAGGTNATQEPVSLTSLRKQVLDKAGAILKEVGSSASVPSDAHAAVELTLSEVSAAKQRYRAEIIAAIKRHVSTDNISYQEVGSTLSKFFLSKTQEVVAVSFLLSGIVVFIVFRTFVPSLAVILGAVADVSMTVGVMALLRVPLTLASIATLLMLVGFSLDTDVMLSMRVLKRKEGTPETRAFEAMKTGFLMNLTTIGAFGALLVISKMFQIGTYEQIGTVAVIGGFADFIATWLLNASLILGYARKKEGQ